jgi:hypothetical protein
MFGERRGLTALSRISIVASRHAYSGTKAFTGRRGAGARAVSQKAKIPKPFSPGTFLISVVRRRERRACPARRRSTCETATATAREQAANQAGDHVTESHVPTSPALFCPTRELEAEARGEPRRDETRVARRLSLCTTFRFIIRPAEKSPAYEPAPVQCPKRPKSQNLFLRRPL